MNLGRIIARELAGGEAKIICGNPGSSINSYMEWLKWISYVPSSQESKIKDIKEKEINALSINGLEELRKYETERRIEKLFFNYGSVNISKEEYLEVYDYMEQNSIVDLMLSKLSKEEIKAAEHKIRTYKNMSEKEIRRYIVNESQEDNYNELSMMDAYVLHMVSMMNFNNNMIKLNKKLKVQIEVNDEMRKRSFSKAKSYVKKY